MALEDLVIRSQLVPPRQRKGVVRRPRLEAALLGVLDFPVTTVHAGTGYGKSTALSALADMVGSLAWYTITEPDRDSLLFHAHLICAFEREEPEGCTRALRILGAAGGRVTPDALTPLLNALTLGLDHEAVLVLDDYHLVADIPEIAGTVERVVGHCPPRLHVVISSRLPPALPALTRLRARGQVLSLTRAEFAFGASEIEALFRDEYAPITPEQAEKLATETEGWAIALQMVGRSLRAGDTAGQLSAGESLDEVLGHLPSTLDSLFDYLAQDVLARLPEPFQRFLVATSVLREMEGAACDHLLEVEGSVATLRRLYEDGLFVVSLEKGVYRFQRLFHDFLLAQLRRDPARWQALHRRAAGYFREAGHPEESVYHLLEAGEYAPAAELLAEIGPGMVAIGRLDSLSTWIACLPQEVRSAHPALDLLLGDVLRLRAHFDEALLRYEAAEARYAQASDRLGRCRSLRGQAQVYLDTVRPLKADSLLEDALRLLEPMEHRDETAILLDLLAENKLNLGQLVEAQSLHHEARLLRTETDPDELYLEARAMLRTGRHTEARRLLEKRAEEESRADFSRPQRFHRETLLLLSLICAFQGDGAAAEQRAREGIAIGQRIKSAFVEAVGYMRLGHALQLRETLPWERDSAALSGDWWSLSAAVSQAKNCYERAIEQARAFNVMRTYVEPLWGLIRLHGYGGDLVAARRYADEALEIGGRAGDEWICDLGRVTMGASYAMHGVPDQARAWLSRAQEGFERVADAHGQSASLFWLALNAWWSGETDQAFSMLPQLLGTVRERGWEALLVSRTFLGLKDDQAALPLLVEAHRRGIEVPYLGRLLAGLGLADAEYHPGYTLWVRTMGHFAVWRGDRPLADRDWQREKARQVFQYLLTRRGQSFYREQISEQLWPSLSPESADRDFRVAYTSLTQALEPGRPRTAAAFFVPRRGSVYGLRSGVGVRVDADQFEQLAASDDIDLLRRAVALYDDYLPDSLYEDWPAAERQRLRQAYLVAAERLARSLLRAKAWQETIAVCEAILFRDPCWEPAYRLLMRAHFALGDREVRNVYQRCVAALREELGVEPSKATASLFDKLS